MPAPKLVFNELPLHLTLTLVVAAFCVSFKRIQSDFKEVGIVTRVRL
jgi:hypothetical protein